MTPEEEKSGQAFLDFIHSTARDHISVMASLIVLENLVADLMCGTTGKDKDSVMKEIRQKIHDQEQEFLIQAEDIDSATGAKLSQIRPLISPNDPESD